MGPRCCSIKQHYESVWKKPAAIKRWTQGPVHRLPADFCVIEVDGHPEDNAWAYGTCCMSQPEDPRGLELHLFSPQPDDSQVELLTIVADYHRTGQSLGWGHTINIGRPWLPGSTCSFGLISLPYLDGEELEIFQSEWGQIQFLWLIPITEQERDFKKTNGLDALEEAFEKSMLNYLDPYRKSVV
jgi:hypothetical protein